MIIKIICPVDVSSFHIKMVISIMVLGINIHSQYQVLDFTYLVSK